MADCDSDITMFGYTKEIPGNEYLEDPFKALRSPPNNPGEYPSHVRPKLNFLSVFTQVAPFADGLREAGGLDRYDYTRLRMVCTTIAQVFRPYPYDRLEPDTKERYFTGLQAIACDDCGTPSSSLVVKPCHGMGSRSAGRFSGCDKLLSKTSIEPTESQLGRDVNVVTHLMRMFLINQIPNGSVQGAEKHC
ncbi:hypothetical protein Z517_08042 [Fonsecaea pedrosoi CBS 271.37]|uniref:Uncharacterized protein n=1 Tax=Fonsecaea pedrosoi CBS 271.37 TaxID=1442368 RepID=A0A0D2H0K4_9EURO|nr:uncharacterized protein Z517_08042 [Fonsecaea pedrosoi CBS 271.37]KIW78209.1 hypothetical protein Z517_08042 [Fonsecaea pedrosoi CBS 271.37]